MHTPPNGVPTYLISDFPFNFFSTLPKVGREVGREVDLYKITENLIYDDPLERKWKITTCVITIIFPHER